MTHLMSNKELADKYDCRFWFWETHDWGKWSNPVPGEAICFNKWRQAIYVQERTCRCCNKRELREAR